MNSGAKVVEMEGVQSKSDRLFFSEILVMMI
jgi:hypothetical protein